MSDEIALLLILAGLHLMESCQIVPHGAVIFRAGWWARHTATRAAALMRVSRGRFVFLNPFDTRAHVFTSGLPHLLPTAEGILDVAPEEDDALRRRPFVPWSAIGPARAAEGRVLCEGLGVFECGSPSAARLWARVLNTLRTAPPDRRSVLAGRWLRLRFAPAIARRRHERVRRACAWLEVVASTAFILVGAGALVLTQRVSTPIILGFFGTGVLSGIAIAAAYWHAHARLEPRDWSTRLGRALMMVACFPVAFRARAGLDRGALAVSHPAAVASVLLPAGRAPSYFATTLRRWTHLAAPPAAGSTDERHLTHAATSVVALVHEAAREAGVDPHTLPAAPDLGDPAIRAWCPRCHATYAHTEGTCADCPGVSLRPARR